MTDEIAAQVGVASRPAPNLRRAARAAAFLAFAAFIVFGPFAAQVLHVRHAFARPWTMFSEIGVGILDGEFSATARDGSVAALTPLQVLSAERYPLIRSIHFPLRVVEDGDLRKFADRYCAEHDVRLAFSGRVGTRQGWRDLKAGDICAWPSYELRQ